MTTNEFHSRFELYDWTPEMLKDEHFRLLEAIIDTSVRQQGLVRTAPFRKAIGFDQERIMAWVRYSFDTGEA